MINANDEMTLGELFCPPSTLSGLYFILLCVLCDYPSDELCFMYCHDSLQNGKSSLILASWEGHTEVVKMLLSSCANVDLQDNVNIIFSSPSPASSHPNLLYLMCMPFLSTLFSSLLPHNIVPHFSRGLVGGKYLHAAPFL